MSEAQVGERQGTRDSASNKTNTSSQSRLKSGQDNVKYLARSVDKNGAINTIDIVEFWEYSI